ncbi:MAG TPA: hypothetical protein VN844_26400 [Pyrinomonadaceae bacterium]|nr:hypothetical protein [Pyrinomonadaceae bacterium]
MKEDAASESTLRQFLLGNVDQEARERLESLFITDSVAREKILAAEQDLIDDYLDGSLTSEEKQSFIQQYADTPVQKRKLRIAASIKDWATAQGEEPAPPPEPARASFWSRVRDILLPKPAIAIPIAATAMVGVIALAIWLNSRMEPRDSQLAMQEEIVQLNVPSNLSKVPAKMPSLELRPGSTRSGDSQDELVNSPDSGIAELRLLWIQEQYPRYTAVVRRVGSNKSVTIADLHAEDDGKSIRFRLPDSWLTRGEYLVELTGITANGAAGVNEEYRFSVRN